MKAPFIDEISGLSIIKIPNGSTYSTMLLKLKFTHNARGMLGIVHLRSLGYYKIKQGILQQNISKYYGLERPDTLCISINL